MSSNVSQNVAFQACSDNPRSESNTPINHKKIPHEPLHVVRSASATVVSRSVRKDSRGPTDWLVTAAHLKTLAAAGTPSSTPFLAADSERGATGCRSRGSYGTQLLLLTPEDNGMRGPGNCSTACACGDVAMWWCYAWLPSSHNDTNPTAASCVMR